MPDEEGIKPRSRAKAKHLHAPGVGRMETPPPARVPLEAMGRHASRNYCATCGAKKVQGVCPRGHP